MSIERLESMKNSLMSCVEGQLSDLKAVDAHELGEAVDMIKDLAEAIYYCTVTEAMNQKEEEKKSQTNNINYYTTPSSEMRGITYYEDGMSPRMMGTSPTSRKMYIEAKDMHKGNAVQMQELEHYMKDLSKDITDMIQDSTIEEKTMLQQRLMTLANKINPNNVSN